MPLEAVLLSKRLGEGILHRARGVMDGMRSTQRVGAACEGVSPHGS